MKIILISGISGSGKGKIEANIRIAYGGRGAELITISHNVAFLGKYVPESNYNGFSNFRYPGILSAIRKLSARGVQYIVLSTEANFKNFAKQHSQHEIVNFYNYRSPNWLYQQRLKNELKKAVNPNDLLKIIKEVARYSTIKRVPCNYTKIKLRGSMKDRVVTILEYLDYPGTMPTKLTKMPFSSKHVNYWK